MNRTAANLSPLAAAAFAFAALAMTAPAASADTSPYQRNLRIDCNGTCERNFPQLPANTALDIDTIICEISSEGILTYVHLQLLPDSLNFRYPLTLTWQRKFLDATVYTLSADAKIRVPQGRQVQIQIVSGGEPNGICAITGTKITS